MTETEYFQSGDSLTLEKTDTEKAEEQKSAAKNKPPESGMFFELEDSMAPDSGALDPDAPDSDAPDSEMDQGAKESAPPPSPTAERNVDDIPIEKKKSRRLGERLIESAVITQDQLDVALHEQSRTGGMIGEVLVELGFVSAGTLSSILSEASGFAQFDPAKTVVDPDALALLNKAEATKFQVLPISVEEEIAHFAMADPYDVVAMDRLRQILPRGTTIQPLICPPAILSDAIDRSYGYASSIKEIMAELGGEEVDLQGLESLTDDNAYSHPIVRLVNALVIDAVKIGASDIHFEPEENFVRLRYRTDGVLITVQTIHKEYWAAISQRLKIISGMNIADKLLPQDGRFYLGVGGREADFRVSSLPTVHGENFVLRILDKQSGIMALEDLGFSPHNLDLIRKSQSRPEGIIIVTGPTGSGKTTSLYSMLNAINTPDVNIMTLEDPVEYSLPMIRQTHVRGGAGLNFADGVKALLRQDPDIIFIGEVRDQVTAEQALKAAMTGHQVYTTLHTNDCFGAIPRLLDLGLQPGMLSGAIIASFAQRLVRRLCSCKETAPATAEECRLMELDPDNPPEISSAVGCDKCDGFGYKGRTAVVEILFTNSAINDVIAEGAHISRLKEVAREHGFKSMLDDGIVKVLEKQTSLDALMKVVDFSERL